MNVTLAFVPPDGGEVDYQLDFNLLAPPNAGDYISVRRPGQEGTADFMVRRCRWGLHYPAGIADHTPHVGRVESLVVECEFAMCSHSCESHKTKSEAYRSKGKTPKAFEE